MINRNLLLALYALDTLYKYPGANKAVLLDPRNRDKASDTKRVLTKLVQAGYLASAPGEGGGYTLNPTQLDTPVGELMDLFAPCDLEAEAYTHLRPIYDVITGVMRTMTVRTVIQALPYGTYSDAIMEAGIQIAPSARTKVMYEGVAFKETLTGDGLSKQFSVEGYTFTHALTEAADRVPPGWELISLREEA